MWDKIKCLSDKHGYMSGINRMSDRIKSTGEVFTPTDLVIEILQNIPISQFAPGKTVLDPACGDGQFLVPVKWLKILYFGMSEEDALKDIYGVDIMRDNVDLCKKRLNGGNIFMGNALKPKRRLEEQTDKEYERMKEIFYSSNQIRRNSLEPHFT
jgi:type I restriction-modification system DNA methylase subunit